MFYLQDGFFHVNGVSFRLPDGFYLDSCPEEHYKNSFSLYPEDTSFWLQIIVSEDCMDAGKELEYLFIDNTGMKPLGPVTPIAVNGFTGYQTVYCGGLREYYEIRLNLPCGQRLCNFVMVLMAITCSIGEAIAHPGVRQVLKSLQSSRWRGVNRLEEWY